MKLPGKVRSMIDEMGLSSKDKTAVLRHLNDMADSLPEHPTPAEAKRIVDGALKKVGAGKKKDEEKPEEKEEKKEKKEDKPKEEKKEKVEEARKLSFKAFLGEAFKGPTVDEVIKVMQKVNSDIRKTKSGDSIIPLSDWETNADQLFAMYEDDNMTEAQAEKLAKEMAAKAKAQKLSDYAD